MVKSIRDIHIILKFNYVNFPFWIFLLQMGMKISINDQMIFVKFSDLIKSSNETFVPEI